MNFLPNSFFPPVETNPGSLKDHHATEVTEEENMQVRELPLHLKTWWMHVRQLSCTIQRAGTRKAWEMPMTEGRTRRYWGLMRQSWKLSGQMEPGKKKRAQHTKKRTFKVRQEVIKIGYKEQKKLGEVRNLETLNQTGCNVEPMNIPISSISSINFHQILLKQFGIFVWSNF